MDKDTVSLIQKIATDAAIAAVESSQRKNLARVAELTAEPIKAARDTNLSVEFDILYKSTVELEEGIKILAERIAPVLRNNLENKVGLARALSDKDAPLVNALSERSGHIQTLNLIVRELASRVQITS